MRERERQRDRDRETETERERERERETKTETDRQTERFREKIAGGVLTEVLSPCCEEAKKREIKDLVD